MIKAATKYVQVAGADVLHTIGPHFKTLVQDPKWRVRVEVIEGAADLAVFFQVSNFSLNKNNWTPFFKIFLPILILQMAKNFPKIFLNKGLLEFRCVHKAFRSYLPELPER